MLKAKNCIQKIEKILNHQNKSTKKIVIEVLPLTNFISSDEEHQHRLTLHPNDHSYCHIPLEVLHKYKKIATNS
ncbi:peptide-methionine (S)-S-oxide reductase [Polaribacter sejongensis]